MLAVRSALRASTASAARLSTAAVAAGSSGEHPLFSVFPREREGLDYSLNWALAGLHCAPSGDAFRNASPEALQAALAASDGAAAASAAVAPAVAADGPRFAAQLTAAKEALRSSAALYVHDGALDSSPGATTKVRIVSDSPAVALAARALSVRTPLREADAPASVTAWVLSEGAAAAAGSSGSHLLVSEAGQQATVLIAGTHAGSLRSALSAAVDALFASSESVAAVSGHLCRHDGGYALVVGEGADVDSKQKDVVAAHRLLWSADGIARVFDGSVASADGAAAMLPPAYNVYPQPSTVMVVGAKKGSEAAAAEAALPSAAKPLLAAAKPKFVAL
eukprot:PLAT6778.1.p2 GENE.PLAT6778.1~~PLAT6778.1.p2  ORF type:complete len:336 (+),score=157.72 PLAT6778.1:36-1043(+)